MEHTTLQKAGLTKNESKVYLALLKVGTSKTGKILKEAGINSGKIYDILENLKNKGLVSESEIDGTRNFTASPPNHIIEHMEKQKEKIEQKEQQIKQKLPQLKQLRQKELEEFRTAEYTGPDGFKSATDEAMEYMNKDKELLVMGSTGKKGKGANKFWEIWTKKKARKGIKQKCIFEEEGEFYEKIKSIENVECKVLELFKPATIAIYPPETIVIYNFLKKPINSVLIKDRNITLTFKETFKELWDIATKK